MKNSLRLVFMGTPSFSASFLSALIQSPYQIVGIATQPDRPAGRGRQLQSSPVKVLALEHGIPVFQSEDLSEASFIQSIQELQADLFVIVAYSILPKSLLAIPRLGSINVHTSLLPKFRGAAPVQHALWRGESETGLSIFQLDEKMDHGPLLAQWKTSIRTQDNYLSVMTRFENSGPLFLIETLDRFQTGNFAYIQQDHSLACKAPKLNKEDGLIDWNQSAAQVHNQIRALCAWPVAYSFLKGKVLRIQLSSPDFSNFPNLDSATPGTLYSSDHKKLWVRCSDSWIELLKVQPEGRKEVSGGEFWRGLQDREGLCLRNQD